MSVNGPSWYQIINIIDPNPLFSNSEISISKDKLGQLDKQMHKKDTCVYDKML